MCNLLDWFFVGGMESLWSRKVFCFVWLFSVLGLMCVIYLYLIGKLICGGVRFFLN